jgi:hypothetical protein
VGVGAVAIDVKDGWWLVMFSLATTRILVIDLVAS